ncbi:hypothetical protein [Gemmatimonas sp.]|uniref:hypothetical protein n=1 Tax=Gemmatimonas sp. TaxID=1962908 RepID=UPI003983B378
MIDQSGIAEQITRRKGKEEVTGSPVDGEIRGMPFAPELRRTRRVVLALTTAVAASACSAGATDTPPTGTPAPIPPLTYVAGQSYFGRSGYVEYVAGNAPVILTASHGGALSPSSIPDRTAGACGGSATTVTDANTQELIRSMQARYAARFGTVPHVVISHLARRKLDPNRLQPEAACGNAEAAQALSEWHSFIDAAKSAVLAGHGKGWYMDMHGHGHAVQRLELGYLVSGAQLDGNDATLDASSTIENGSSMLTLSLSSPLSFATLLRGPASLGTLYAARGFPAVPSSSDPRPNGAEYFNGGDNTRRHSCGSAAGPLGGTTGGLICGVQIEANFVGVRDNATNRDRFGDVTAQVLEQFLRVHWGLQLAP